MAEQPFWDRIAHKYANKPVDDQAAYENKLTLVASLLKPEDKVLEIGCGTGTTALRLAPKVIDYIATDGSRAMIEIAKSKLAAGAPTNVSFLQADADKQIASAPFDAIFAFSLLHLVDDMPTVLSAVEGQLKPGGLFLSKTVCVKAIAWPLQLILPILTALRIAPRVTPLSEADLVRALEDAGFEVDQVMHLGQQRTNPIILARKLA